LVDRNYPFAAEFGLRVQDVLPARMELLATPELGNDPVRTPNKNAT